MDHREHAAKQAITAAIPTPAPFCAGIRRPVSPLTRGGHVVIPSPNLATTSGSIVAMIGVAGYLRRRPVLAVVFILVLIVALAFAVALATGDDGCAEAAATACVVLVVLVAFPRPAGAIGALLARIPFRSRGRPARLHAGSAVSTATTAPRPAAQPIGLHVRLQQ